MFIELIISILLLLGAGFALLGSFGLARLPDFFTRLHSPTKATTLGLGGILGASAIYGMTTDGGLTLRPLLITVFLFMTAPVSAHLLARAAIAGKVRSLAPFPEDDRTPSTRRKSAKDHHA
jgi:multicomponent K+:H+ antiporter subunit G